MAKKQKDLIPFGEYHALRPQKDGEGIMTKRAFNATDPNTPAMAQQWAVKAKHAFREIEASVRALLDRYGQPAEPMVINAIFETEDGEVIGTTEAKVKRYELQDDGSITVVIDYWPQPTEPAKDHEIAQAVNQIRDAALDFRDAGQLRARIADIVVPLIKRADRKRRGKSKDRRDIREIVKKLQSAYVKDGSTDEWVRLRRHVLEEAIDTLRLVSADCDHFYDAYKVACDRAAPQPAEPVTIPETVASDHSEPVKVPSDAQIREVFIAHGFTIKPGNRDLKPYVYEAARALLDRYGAK